MAENGNLRYPEGLQKSIFRISGMDCGDCAAKLEKRLAAMPGVRSAMINFGAGKLTVEHNITDSALIQTVKQAGYGAIKEEATRQPMPETVWWKNGRTLTTIASGVMLAIATVFDWLGMTGVLLSGSMLSQPLPVAFTPQKVVCTASVPYHST